MTNHPTYEELASRVKDLEKEFITRKDAERALKESEERFRSTIASLDDLIFVLDKKGTFTEYYQPPDKPDLYAPPETFLGKEYREVLPPDLSTLFDTAISSVMSSDRVKQIEYNLQISGGINKYIAKLSARKNASGKTVGIVAAVRNITHRKRTEELVRIQRDLGVSLGKANEFSDVLRLCLKAALNASEMDCGGIYIVNRTTGALEFLYHEGLTDNFVMAVSYYEADSPNAKMIMSGDPVYTNIKQLEIPLLTVDDNELKAIAVFPIKHANRVVGCLNVGSHTYEEVPRFARNTLETISSQIGDSIANRQAEEALRESEERYRALFEGAPDAIILVDPDNGTILDANSAASRLLMRNHEEIKALKQFEIHPPEGEEYAIKSFHNHVRTLRQKKPITPEENVILRSDGIQVPVEVMSKMINIQGKPVLQGIFRDISERKRMEAELLTFHKLESIGILAGGIAHDFNNILMAIWGNIHLAKMHTESGKKEEAIENLDHATKACQRARDLSQQLITFSKGGEPVKKPTSISKIIEDTTAFSVSGSNVKCHLNIQDDLWSAEVDEGQISQVVINLLMNAVQAIPEGGDITVSAENITLTEPDPIPLKPGEYVQLSIQDHGIGINQENLSNIFDPYFTTKQKGSGLGLAVVHSIIWKHNGYITVESEPGMGTTFYVYLPACKKETMDEDTRQQDLIHGEGRILLMDDEKMVRLLIGQYLTHLGYEVEFAEDGHKAIELYRQSFESGKPFDVTILDLTVPGGMGGQEAVKELLTIDPDAKVIVSSGYSNDPVMANYEKYGFAGVIPKPYKIAPLSEVLKNIITMTR